MRKKSGKEENLIVMGIEKKRHEEDGIKMVGESNSDLIRQKEKTF